MKAVKHFCTAAALLGMASATGQSGVTSVTPPGINIAEHVPQSPTASGLGRYFEVPVNMNTGQPQISIPIYTIKTGNITVPIALSYNAGGVRVNDHAGWVGMGWSINVGGHIQKRVNGLDDFSVSSATSGGVNQMQPYVNPAYQDYGMSINNLSDIVDSCLVSNTSPTPLQRAIFLGRVANGNLDGEADEYFYSTPEGGGKLFYSQKEGKFIFDKYNGWKADHTMMGSDDIQTFVLLNTTGLQYEFGATDYYKNPWYDRHQGGNGNGASPSKDFFNQGWQLARIRDIVNNKMVEFFNNQTFKTSYNGFSMNRVYQEQVSSGGIFYTYKSENVEQNLRRGTEVTPTEIVFNEGRVLFIPDGQHRQDGGTKALKEIQVRNNEGKIIKRLVFGYQYINTTPSSCGYYHYPLGNNWLAISDTMARRMFLTSVQEVDPEGNAPQQSLPPYTFTYHNPAALPARLSFAQDMWGYCNGQYANTTMLASLPPVYPGIPPLANRNVDTAYTRLGSLVKITYPTGGHLWLELENNRHNGELVGGLRVKKIIHQDDITGQQLSTQYEYAGSNVQYPPRHYYSYMNFQGFGMGNIRREMSIGSESIYPLTTGSGAPVLYNTVIKKITGGGSELVSKHYFSNVVQPDFGQAQNSDIGVPMPKQSPLEGFIGIEDNTEIYGPGGTLLQKDSSVYEPLNHFAHRTWNVQAAWASPDFMTEWVIWPGNDPFSTNPPDLSASTNYYALFKENAVRTAQYAQTYEDGIQSVTHTRNIYDKTNGHLLLTRTANSRGDTVINQYRYAANYLPVSGMPTTDASLNYMRDINAIGRPIEITAWLKKKNASDSLLTAATYFAYDSARVRQIYKLPMAQPLADFAPAHLGATGLVKDSRYELEATILDMDGGGNPLTVQDKKGTTALVWDGVNDVLMAKAVNAAHGEVAFTSFETESTGNWQVPSLLTDATAALTGKKSYSLLQGNISKAGLNPANTYTVTYWSKSGPQAVNGSNAATAGATANGFTLYQHTVSGTTQVTLSGSGTIDELRLYPQGALTESYAYSPLTGITAQCSANNQLQYYQYDTMGRLKVARDRANNVLKQFDYRYKAYIHQ
jgi:hypothetical protein